MLQIRTGPVPRGDEPLGFLLECHGRIRHFMGLADRLAKLNDVGPSERAQAATAVHRYFTVAFHLHASDEDELLIPALRQHAEPALRERLDALEPEHRVLDALVAELGPLWARIGAAPAEWGGCREQLASVGARLAEAIERHLSFEEREIFPAAARLLDCVTLAELRAQAARKRQGTPGAPGRR
ncbi:MAG: hemerythrin domain-containing protein [Deltaproteobacteria bacterium]|nr:hemerythrin domain-containing protein [Deltaproteobacteria bacterium]